MNHIRLASAPVLLDDDSLQIDPDWRMRTFANRAEEARRAINAMNILQSTRDGAIEQNIVDQCVDFHLQYLPAMTSSVVSYIPAGSTANPTHLFRTEHGDTELKYLNRTFWKEHREFFRHIRESSWTMFPIGVDGHFVLVIIRATKITAPDVRRGFITMIEDLVVADPLRNAAVEFLVYDRLRDYVLLPRRGFQFANKDPPSLWYPKQGVDALTCGLRLYEVARVMIERISQFVGEEGLRHDFEPDAIWRDMSGDFQADKVRAEMIGIMANRAMQATNWSTRICLVPVSEVKNRSLNSQQGFFVRTNEHGSRLTLLPNNNNMQYNENIPVHRIPVPPPGDTQGVAPADLLAPNFVPTPNLPAPNSPAPNSARRSRGPRFSRSPEVPGAAATPPPSLQHGRGFRWDFWEIPGAPDHWMLIAVPTTGTPIASPDSDKSMPDAIY